MTSTNQQRRHPARGTSILTGTSDLGLYSQNSGSWVRFVTNNGSFRFFSDSGIGSTPDVTINSSGSITATGDLTIQGTINSSCPGSTDSQFQGELYNSAGNSRICYHRSATNRRHDKAPSDCWSNDYGSSLCTYEDIVLARDNSVFSIERNSWVSGKPADDAVEINVDNASFTNNRYDMDGIVDSTDENKPYCCLKQAFYTE